MPDGEQPIPITDHVPKWAQPQNLATALEKQEKADPESIFGQVPPAPSTAELFHQEQIVENSTELFGPEQQAYDGVHRPSQTPCPVPPPVAKPGVKRKTEAREKTKFGGAGTNDVEPTQKIRRGDHVNWPTLNQPPRRPQRPVKDQIAKSYYNYRPSIPLEFGRPDEQYFNPYRVNPVLTHAILTKKIVNEISEFSKSWREIPDLLDDRLLLQMLCDSELGLVAMLDSASEATALIDVVHIVKRKRGLNIECGKMMEFFEFCVRRVCLFTTRKAIQVRYPYLCMVSSLRT